MSLLRALAEHEDPTAKSFNYDAKNRQLTSTNGSAVTTYTYDVRNKMVTFSDGTTTATYVYDDAGNRVRETTGGATTYYLTDTQNPTGYAQPVEAKSSPTATPTTTYILGSRIVAKANGSGVVSYLLTDGHGSTQQITTASGTVTQAIRYDAYGAGININLSQAGSAILFGGDAIYDTLSGLYMHGDGTRDRIGFRFIQADTKGNGRNSDPVSLHKYLYAEDHPIVDNDPSGHNSLSAAALGRAVHKELGNDFAEKLGEFGISGPSIVSILTKYFPPLTNFLGPIASRFPDLVDIDPANKEVFEIKPAHLKAYAAGLVQLIGYITLLNNLDPSGGWHEGNVDTYSPPPLLEVVGSEGIDLVAVFPPIAGVITYSSLDEVV